MEHINIFMKHIFQKLLSICTLPHTLDCPVLYHQMRSVIGKMRCAFYQMMRIWSNAVQVINWPKALRIWSNAPIQFTKCGLLFCLNVKCTWNCLGYCISCVQSNDWLGVRVPSANSCEARDREAAYTARKVVSP